MIAWGSTTNGQLGVGAIEEKQIFKPRLVKTLEKAVITSVCAGTNHSLMLLHDGSVYSCGLNDCGQLGHTKTQSRPQRVDMLETQVVIALACGDLHSLVLTDRGQVFTWGDNRTGQLGLGITDGTNSPTPKMIKRLQELHMIQIVAGSMHTLALSSEGYLYAWGANKRGQLGLGYFSEKEEFPCLIHNIKELPISAIASGAMHTLALTLSDTVFAWGSNGFGQLGVGSDKSDQFSPVPCKTLRDQKIKSISCGQDHSACLTASGGLFTFGAGMYGQLGHNNTSTELLPRKVFELMGSKVERVVCGRCHTIVLINGSIMAFGLNGSGQLGNGNKENCSVPQAVEIESKVQCIWAGGDMSFAALKYYPIETKGIWQVTEQLIDDLMLFPAQAKPPASITQKVTKIFSSIACLNASFLRAESECSPKEHGVDLQLSRNLFTKTSSLVNRSLSQSISSSLLKNLIPNLASMTFVDCQVLRIFLLLPQLNLFSQPELFYSAQCPFATSYLHLANIPQSYIAVWWSTFEASEFSHLVKVYKECLLHILHLSKSENKMMPKASHRNLLVCLDFLQCLKKSNMRRSTGESIISHSDFYVGELHQLINIQSDYVSWRHGVVDHICFCNYSFLYDGAAKSILMMTDALMQQEMAVNSACYQAFGSMLFPNMALPQPYLVITVNRDSLVSDMLNQLNVQTNADFKKPLKVIFKGEEAVDEGGVAKELFQLILREILDPKYGMFECNPESRLIWFNSSTYELPVMFGLIGVICGLAIYNNNIININFPLALYKKILNRPLSLSDLLEYDPTLGRSLQSLLEYSENDFDDIFDLTFEVSRNVFGEVSYVELIPNGKSCKVTKANRCEYVEAYVKYVFTLSVKDQYTAFCDGFRKVCNSKVLELFEPSELCAMVVGNESYDWLELEQGTLYSEPYNRQHPTIVNFWIAFHSFSDEQKKKFLLFLTGNDRIPIHGMKSVKLRIQKMGDDENKLPVAHTCFNLLDLPVYRQLETLRRKLSIAIEHTEGFGIV